MRFFLLHPAVSFHIEDTDIDGFSEDDFNRQRLVLPKVRTSL
jgi:hypothetical protein